MERVLKRLLRMYPVARNWITSSNYTSMYSVYNVRQMCSTNLSDHTELEDVTKLLTRRNNLTFNDINVVQEPMKILEIVETNYKNMSVQSAVNCLTMLFEASKRIKDSDNIESYIEDHIGFIHLCEILNENIRQMTMQHIIESLKVLVYFQTPNSSILIQSLLQMIRVNINELSLSNIIFISFLLNKMKISPMRDALLIALPLVFEIQLPTKLNSDDISAVINSFRYISTYKIQNTDIHDIIFKSLWKHIPDINVKKAKSIFRNLANMSQLPPIGFQVLFKVQDIFISMAKQLSVDDVMDIFRILNINVINKRESIFHNEMLVDALVNSALSSNIDYTKCIDILKTLNDLNHIHIPLLEYLGVKYYKNPILLKNTYKISVFLEGLVNANYKPVFWDTIKEAIINSENIDTKLINKSLIRFSLHLVALDCYDLNLFKEIFFINIRSNEPLRDVYIQEMLLLYQSIKTLCPMYEGPWPQQDLLIYTNIIKVTPPAYSLKPGLERALGGPQYVYNDLKTKLGHRIDHVVVMRKGGYPVAINTDTNNKITYIEDLQTPSGSQMILIFNVPNYAYPVNSQRLKSTWLLKMKSVEALTKSNTISINSNSWMKLPEYERIPYLMQAIKLKCEDLLISIN